ncbi:MAG: protein-export chaperone SecB [Gammaproteobacteria bacterium]|nr:MAG: protein-export chaperone SecB [Gammaproteobacteria bacterium]
MAEEKAPQPNFSIQKIYVKDVSFESPDSPEIFKFTKWDPEIELNLNNAHSKIDDNMYEAVLTVTATVKHEDKVAYLIEVQQAGIFALVGFNENDQKYLLGSQCMNILFPYAREAISDLSSRGGFPPLILAPVNFDALYQQHMQKQSTNQQDSAAQATEMEQDSEKPGAENTRH